MKRTRIVFVLTVIAFLLAMCHKPNELAETDYDERLSGGSQTVFDETSKAFSHGFSGMNGDDDGAHEAGDGHFEDVFVTAPAPMNGGLGPVYNNTSCAGCHHNDGIGMPTTGSPRSSLLMRISFAGQDEHGGAIAVPGYSTQIQDKSIFGKLKECAVNISYQPQKYTFEDGEEYTLWSTSYTLSDFSVAISGNYLLSPRLAPPVFGLGLLEAIPEADILANVDEADANGDGISGKANYVWDPEKNKMMLGRFGLKANTATLLTQVAAAYNNDMGVTNRVFPHETSAGQTQVDDLADDPELPDSVLDETKFYVQTLQVPARRNVTNPDVIKGKQIFAAAKCATCHIPTMYTGVDVVLGGLNNQRIHPYTDMLVHDMGAGLADNRPDFKADGNEWRTAPLWGIGLREKVNYPAFYLHDGRGRSLIEAVMWHGGEAQQAVDYVKKLSKADRDALISFLKSL